MSKLFLLFLIGIVFPLFSIVFLVPDGKLAYGFYESGNYIKPALGLIETGSYVRNPDPGAPPETARLPVYPLIIASIFSLVGKNNFLAVALVQSAMVGLTVVAIALSAAALHWSWFWPAGILAALWPNIAYRASALMPEVTLLLFLSWGLCACLWAAKGERVLPLLFLAGVFFGAAFMTRPAMQLFPFFLFPALLYLLQRKLETSWVRAAGLAVIPIFIIAIFAAPQFIRTYQIYGKAVFSTQAGEHALKWLYPCLKVRFGCGSRDEAAYEAGKRLLEERSAALSAEARANPAIIDSVKREIAFELIWQLPIAQIMTASLASAVKQMLHTSLIEILNRLDRPVLALSEAPGESLGARLRSFLALAVAAPVMWLWAIAMFFLLASRLLQVAGLIVGLRDPELRAQILFLTLTLLPFVIIAAGIGNPRYRVPMEPGLILLTVTGLWAMTRSRQSGETSPAIARRA